MTLNAKQIALALEDEFSIGDIEQIQAVEQGSFNAVFRVAVTMPPVPGPWR
jgi:hypothetical protein